jgi:hypothetical protein
LGATGASRTGPRRRRFKARNGAGR